MLPRFFKEMTALKAELRAGSRVARTSAGPIEYASIGEGPPVLVVHGIGGGYDQGLLVTRLKRDSPLRLISVSRPGYLRTPLRVGATWEAQADAHVKLLDALKIEKAAIVGISAGGPSALLFALRHPHRCACLVMSSAVSMRLVPRLTLIERALMTLMDTDFGLWLASTYAEERLFSAYGIGEGTLRHIGDDPQKMYVLRQVLVPLPMSVRRAGFNNDMRQFPRIPRYPVEQVAVPTLVVHGTADTVVPLAHGEFVANGVVGAERLYVEGGGHLCTVTHSEITLPRIIDFLAEHV